MIACKAKSLSDWFADAIQTRRGAERLTERINEVVERERAKTQANVNKLNNFSDGSKVESIRAQKCTQLS